MSTIFVGSEGSSSGQPFSTACDQSALQSQANQFTGASDSTGLFSFEYPVTLQGVFLCSDAGESVDWAVDIGIEDPGNLGTFQYYRLITQTGTNVLWPDFRTAIPANTKIKVTTNEVVGSNLRAQLTYTT